MLPDTLTPEVIYKLNDISKQIHNVIAYIPSAATQQADQDTLEGILTDANWVTRPYVWGIELAYRYASTHYHRTTGNSMIGNIEADPTATINISDYYGV